MLYSNYNIVLPSLTINRLQIRTRLCYLEKESISKIIVDFVELLSYLYYIFPTLC